MSIDVFCRSANGELSRFEVVGTDDHAVAIAAVKGQLIRKRIKPEGPVLALIEGGKA